VTYLDIENAVRAWVLDSSELDPACVYFADQPYPVSEVRPRIAIRLGALVPIGHDWLGQTYDPTRPAGQEIEYSSKGARELSISLQAFAPTTVGGGDTARELLERVFGRLVLPSIRDALNAAGIGILRTGAVQRTPTLVGTLNEDRSVGELVALVSSSYSERVGYIERAEVAYGGGPVLDLLGSVDVAGLLALTRYPRADQPAYPRVVPGPRGRPGVQFSRLGATVVSTVARDRGVLADPNMDRAAFARATRSGFTFAWWIRPDPLVDLGPSTSQSARLFAFAGAEGPSAGFNLFIGVTWARDTNTFIVNTQVPISAAVVNGRSTSYAGPSLPLGVWAHLACSLAPNGLDVAPYNFGATANWYLNGSLAFTQVGDGAVTSVGPRIPVLDAFVPPRTVGSVGAQWSAVSGAYTFPFDATLAELLMYPRPLSASEVGALYTTGPFGLRA